MSGEGHRYPARPSPARRRPVRRRRREPAPPIDAAPAVVPDNAARPEPAALAAADGARAGEAGTCCPVAATPAPAGACDRRTDPPASDPGVVGPAVVGPLLSVRVLSVQVLPVRVCSPVVSVSRRRPPVQNRPWAGRQPTSARLAWPAGRRQEIWRTAGAAAVLSPAGGTTENRRTAAGVDVRSPVEADPARSPPVPTSGPVHADGRTRPSTGRGSGTRRAAMSAPVPVMPRSRRAPTTGTCSTAPAGSRKLVANDRRNTSPRRHERRTKPDRWRVRARRPSVRRHGGRRRRNGPRSARVGRTRRCPPARCRPGALERPGAVDDVDAAAVGVPDAAGSPGTPGWAAVASGTVGSRVRRIGPARCTGHDRSRRRGSAHRDRARSDRAAGNHTRTGRAGVVAVPVGAAVGPTGPAAGALDPAGIAGVAAEPPGRWWRRSIPCCPRHRRRPFRWPRRGSSDCRIRSMPPGPPAGLVAAGWPAKRQRSAATLLAGALDD